MSETSQQATEDSGSSFLAEVPRIIDAVARLFELAWNKSPYLGTFLLVMAVIFPFYVVYTLRTVWGSERALDRRVRNALKASGTATEESSQGRAA